MEKPAERISAERLLHGLNKYAAREGERYRVQVNPLGNNRHPRPYVAIAMERVGTGETKHAVVFFPDERPSQDDTKLTPAQIRKARDELEKWADAQGGGMKD